MPEVLTQAPAELRSTGGETIAPIQTPQPAESMTGSEASNLLSFYNVDPNQVYSDANIQSTLTRPESASDDLLGIRSQIQYDTGYTEAKAKFDAIDKAVIDYNQQSKSGALDISGWLQRHEAVVGEQETYLGQRSLGLENLLLEKNTLGKRLNELGEEVSYRTAISEKNIDYVRELKMSYPGAGFKMGDSMDKMERRLEKYIKKQEKKSEKQSYKDALKDLGLSDKGSRGELKRRLKKESAEAYARAKESDNITLESARLSLEKLRKSLSSGGGGKTYWDDNGTVNQSIMPNSSSSESYDDPLSSWD